MAEQINVEITFTDGQLNYTQELMNVMWEPSQLSPHPVENGYAFEYKGERFGIVDLLCYIDQVNSELSEQGPEAIIEAVLELINAVYIGDESFLLVGKVIDLYGIENEGRVGIVFRVAVLDGRKEIEEMMEVREAAKTLFPVPQPE